MIILNKKYRLLLFYSTLLFSLFLCLKSYEKVDVWRASHFLFRYDGDLIKRGLVGSILDLLISDPIRYQTISLISVLFSVVTILMLAIISCYFVHINEYSYRAVFFSSLFLISPFTLRYISIDNGRLDIINFAFTLFLSLNLILKKNKGKFYYICLLCFSLISLFIHEASLLLSIPLLLSLSIIFLYIRQNINNVNLFYYKNRLIYITFFSVLFLCLSLIFLLGSPSKTPAEFYANMNRISDFTPNKGQVQILYRPLLENFYLTFHNRMIKRKSFEFGIFILAILLVNQLIWIYFPLYFLNQFFNNSFKINKKFLICITSLPIISPLILIPIGDTTQRWISWSVMNSYVLYFFINIYYYHNMENKDKKNYKKSFNILFKISISPVIFSFVILSFLIFSPHKHGYTFTTFFDKFINQYIDFSQLIGMTTIGIPF